MRSRTGNGNANGFVPRGMRSARSSSSRGSRSGTAKVRDWLERLVDDGAEGRRATTTTTTTTMLPEQGGETAVVRQRSDQRLPDPMTVQEMYDGAMFETPLRSPKWREQLLERPVHKRSTAVDTAEIVLALEEGELSCMLAFSEGDATTCFLADEAGIWAQVNSKRHHEVLHALGVFTDRLDRMAIGTAKQLVRRLRQSVAASTAQANAQAEDVERATTALADAEEHLTELVRLYERLRTPAVLCGVVDRILMMRVMETRAEGVTPDSMDAARCCVAFTDGVFDLRAGRLRRGAEARPFHQTLTVRYSYESMVRQLLAGRVHDDGTETETEWLAEALPGPEVVRSGPGWAAYDAFVSRIFSSTPEVRPYLVDLLASSALNENRQVVVVHHNTQGANGKSSLFGLIKQAFGALYMKCSSNLLATNATGGGASAPNEELMSTRSRRLVLFSEPSTTVKLSAAFIKELTGGDEQSTRANYGRKQTFTFRGMVHVLCNKIPEIDDMEGGMRRRLRCIPYGSRFVDPDSEEVALAAAHTYVKAEDVDEHFGEWKHFLMWEVLRAAVARAKEGGRPPLAAPEVVKASTRDLIQRECTTSAFVAACLERSPGDKVALKDMYAAYVGLCCDLKKPANRKKAFKEDMVAALGPLVLRSNGQVNFWRGWRLRDRPLSDGDEDDDANDPLA